MKTGPKPLSKYEAVMKALKDAEKQGDCLIRTNKATCGDGYKIIGAEGTQFYAHRLVYEILIGDIKDLVIRHSCDNPACINPDHLRGGTHADNVKDKVSRKRHPRGELSSNAKLTNKIIIFLRSHKKPKIDEWCKEYGITQGALKSMYYGHTWKHLPLREDLQD